MITNIVNMLVFRSIVIKYSVEVGNMFMEMVDIHSWKQCPCVLFTLLLVYLSRRTKLECSFDRKRSCPRLHYY